MQADMTAMAIRIGELRAVAGSIGSAAGALECGGDLGPGDISGALQSMAEQWREGLSKMNDKIGTMADNVGAAMDGYAEVERASAARFGVAVDQRAATSANPGEFVRQMDDAVKSEAP